MATIEKVFEREFKSMMKERQHVNMGFSVNDIPVPTLDLITLEDYVANGTLAYVKGISEKFFDKLNTVQDSESSNEENEASRMVEVIKGRSFNKRQGVVDDDGSISFRKDYRTGELVTKEVSVAKDFVAVYSPRNIHLKNKEGSKNVRIRDGFGYIDYADTKKGRKYMYTLPTSNIYPVDLCALVISLNKHRTFYQGYKLALTNGYYVYVYVIPYKYKDNPGYKTLGMKASDDFEYELDVLFHHWVENSILQDLDLTEIQTEYGEPINLGCSEELCTFEPEPYARTHGSIKSMKTTEYFQDEGGVE